MLAIFPAFLLIGLFLPGFFIAKYLRHPLWPASAFAISLLVLFQSIFWLGVFHVPIRLGTVLPILLAVSAGGAVLWKKSAARADKAPAPAPLTREDRVLIVSCAAVAAALLAHSAITPLMGGDTLFRWDFLAQRMLRLDTFSFYPPLTAADFRTYFFVDGIPPLVSFANWWIYASAGAYMPALICLFVAAQFVCTLAFTYGAASAVFTRRTGILAAAILAACPLYFSSVVLGQETGLTALAVAATLYFIFRARAGNDLPAMVSAGLAAALCALSREYGWIALVAGVIALVWRRQRTKDVLIFGGVAVAAAGPWYLRNWILAGNPFYSLTFGNFAVNSIHTALLEFYTASLGVKNWAIANWVGLLLSLVPFAFIQVLAGIPGSLQHFKSRGYLAVIGLLLAAVWIQSIGFTSGGAEKSARVLSPLMVVLSITAAGLLESLARSAGRARAIVLAILLCQLWTAAEGAVYPRDLLALPPAEWLQNAFPRVGRNVEFEVADQLLKLLPPGRRVLSDSAYLHAALIDKGVEVVPVWSPEVRFLFSATPEESDRKLRDLKIGSVVCYPKTINMTYLASASPFYATLPERWRAQAQVGDFLYILVPRNP
jgi:hypothetical protein